MKINRKAPIFLTLLAFISPLQNSFAQLPDEFEENTIDTVPISEALPIVVLIAITFAFVLYRKKKTVC